MNVVEIANIINTRIYRKVGYAVTKIANIEEWESRDEMQNCE